MSSFWNRPVWYVALLRCVAGGVVGAGIFFAELTFFPALNEVMMRPLLPGLEAKPGDTLAYLLAFVLAGLSLFAWVRVAMLAGKASAIVVYRGQGRVRFVPQYVVTLLFAYLSWLLLVCCGLPELIYSFLVDILSMNWREQEGLMGWMIGTYVVYLFVYVISLYVYRCVELAREAPTEES